MAAPILIAGGGTAGHVLPGLSIAAELLDRGHPVERLWWIGSNRGQEAQLVGPTGIELTTLPGRGVQRRLTLQNVGAIAGLCAAFVRAVWLIGRRRPAVVLTLGGYASVAAAVAAVIWRVPIVVAEQNARAGAANRLVGRFAVACAVPFEGTDLPHAVVCGNPVRPEVLDAARHRRDDARRAMGVDDDRLVILVFAGSLGARRINDATVGLVERWRGRGDLEVRHVWGRRGERVDPDVAGDPLRYVGSDYEERMPLALRAADVVVCRAGGTTVAELGVIGVGGVLVPLPIATRDHQTANASALVDAGAAVLVPDEELDVDRLEAELSPFLEPGVAARRGELARTVGRPDAASRVADLLEESMR